MVALFPDLEITQGKSYAFVLYDDHCKFKRHFKVESGREMDLYLGINLKYYHR